MNLVATASWLLLQLGDLTNAVSVDVDLDPAVGLFSSAVGSFLLTVAVGAIMVALAPAFTESKMERIRAEPLGSFLYGFTCLVFVVLVTVVLVITIIGILVAIPFLLATMAIWAVGSAIAFLAIAERLVDAEDGWLRPLLLAGALNGGLALSGIGWLLSFCVGAAGFGAVLREYL
jgi:hypothetical protein